MEDVWQKAAADIEMRKNHVHLWRIPLRIKPEHVSKLAGFLQHEENLRAEKFKFTKDWRQFVAARGVLRWLLGRYLNENPGSIRFRYGKFEKPFLDRGFQKRGLNFNVSHSGDLAVIGFVLGASIGVDVERILPDFGGEAIARRFFAEGEVRDLRRVPRHDRPLAFYNGWTRKEAYLKARGGGLSTPLRDFEVTLMPGKPAAFRKVIAPEQIEDWTILSFEPGEGYVGALVVENVGLTLEYFDWSPELL